MFDTDLFNARQIERQFVCKILDTNIIKVEFGETDEWDVKLTCRDGSITTYEIKDSNRATTHVPFECEYNGKPSGIFNSKADYIVYYFDNTFYIQRRGKLINELMDVNKYKTTGGDGNKSVLWIVEKDIAKLLFDKVE